MVIAALGFAWCVYLILGEGEVTPGLSTAMVAAEHAATTSDFTCLLCVRRRRDLAWSMVSTHFVAGHHPHRYRPNLPDGMPGRLQCNRTVTAQQLAAPDSPWLAT